VPRLSADAAILPALAVMGARAAGDRAAIHALHPRFRPPICARTGRQLEGTDAGQHIGAVMITPVEARSGKGHRDENFPVASRVIHPRHRAPILAFSEFVPTAAAFSAHSPPPP